jgi:outer membrane protein insertion porin family
MGAIGIGNIDYVKSTLRLEMNQPLIKINGLNKVMLHIGTYQGFITGIKSDSMITPVELFYMGGNGLGGINITPLRGYQDQSVGPYYGGRVISHYYTELRFAMTQDPMPIFIYAFAEAGNVWHSLKYADPFSLKRSAGFGVRMLLNPIGIIGFSYGFGFDKNDRTGKISGWRFLFHFGQ